jgi:hypothetical protein
MSVSNRSIARKGGNDMRSPNAVTSFVSRIAGRLALIAMVTLLELSPLVALGLLIGSML